MNTALYSVGKQTFLKDDLGEVAWMHYVVMLLSFYQTHSLLSNVIIVYT